MTSLEHPDPSAMTDASTRRATEAQARLDAFLRAAPVGVALLDTEARYVQVNDAVARAAGRRARDFVGRHPSELWDPRVAAIVEEATLRALATGDPVEDVTLSSDGDPSTRVHWSADFFPATSSEGTRLGVGMLARDIGAEVETDRARTRTAQRATTLAAVGQLLETGLDSYDTLERLARVVVEHLADWCLIDLVEEDQLRRAVAHHRDPAEVRRGRRREAGEEELARRVSAEGGTGRLGSGLLSVALTARGRPLGVLTLVRDASGGFDEDDLALAVELGRRAGIAVDNAQLFRSGLREQRATEEALATLESYLDRAPVGFALLDDGFRFVRANAALATITGHTSDEHLGRTPGALLGEVGAEIERELARVRETGEPRLDLELAGTLPGTPHLERQWLVSLYRVELPGGDALGIGATVVETTDHYRIEQELTAQRDLYETLLRAQSQMGEAFVLVEDGRAVYVNEATERITGRSARELYDLPSLAMIFPPEAVAALRRRIERVSERQEGVAGFEKELIRPSGERRTVEISMQPLESLGTKRLVILARDVTARREEELERERLLHAEQRARRETELAHRDARSLAQLSEILDGSMELARTMPEACRLLLEEGVDTARIDLVERGGILLRCEAAGAADPALDASARRLVGHEQPIGADHPRTRILRTGEALWSVMPDERYRRAMASSSEQLALLDGLAPARLGLLPLVSRGRTVGIVVLGWNDAARLPDPGRRAHLTELARRLAIGVDNAQLYGERAHIASTLQAGLLPSALPAIPRLQTAAHYLPAGTAAEVGGDFYDLFAVGPERWALAVGDVCGKGAEAAAVTAMARYTLRAASLAGAAGPSESFALLNEAMVGEQVGERFLTAVMGEVQVSEDRARLRLACAGHPSPILVRAGGRAEAVEISGGLLGISREFAWEEQTLELAPGDGLVLFTDGVTEADRQRPLSSAELARELGAALDGRAPDSAEALAGALRALANDRADGPLRDDVAIVALRFEG